MAEYDITKRLNKLIKNTDKLVQDVEKDFKSVINALVELRMSKGTRKDEDESDR